MTSKPKVMVSGCYDLLHAGHITFFETAAEYGDLYVCIGADDNIRRLKDHAPKFSQDERLYMVQSLRFVTDARVSSGTGMLDFEPDMAEIKPDIFVVNEDGSTEGKRELCERYGVEYVVLPRTPKPGLPARSSTDVKASLGDEARWQELGELPYRICLAGGWLDQPWVSEIYPGPVVTVNIHPTREFNLRSGMATSSRNAWKTIKDYNVFPDDPVQLGRLLFGYENPPGTKYVSGSQDHLGLTLPGVNRLYYTGEHWPAQIDSTTDEGICQWLQESLTLVELFERPAGYDPLKEQNISLEGVRRLAEAGQMCWEAILAKDIKQLGTALTGTHNAWAEILPLTTNKQIEAEMAKYPCYGRVTSGCGGGYIVMATDKEIPDGFHPHVRRQLTP